MKDMPTVAEPVRRKRRFVRYDPPRIVLTERIIAMLAALDRYRYLTSRQLALLDGGSHQKFLRILRAAYDARLIDRPRSQIADNLVEGNLPMIYGLTRTGAGELARATGRDISALNWRFEAPDVKPLFLRHTTELADVMIAFDVGGRETGKASLFDQPELIASLPELAGKDAPTAWRADVMSKGKLHKLRTIPDRLFSLHLSGDARVNFVLELDRGTMPVKRKTLNGTSVIKKYHVYAAGWRAKAHTRFGFERCRILSVAPTDARARSMLKAARDVTDGKLSGFFLFTDLDAVRREGVYAPIWRTINGDVVSLA